ncbi:MAG TPA: hypothetical protein VH063_06565 [Gaiellaceae bacterium]|nr:hypothetical protein [Gaiellaceae bacterium]
MKSHLLEPLGLHPVGISAVNTASEKNVICPRYAVRLGLPRGPLIDISVAEGPEDGLFGDTTQMLIGRDVLQHGILIYMGSQGQFTLAF